MNILRVAGVAFGLCAASAASADMLWYQMPMDLLSGVPSQNAGPGALLRGADDFLLPAGNGQNYVMGVIRGRMVSNLGTGNPSAYRMEIYADGGGRPGQLLLERGAYNVNGFGTDAFGRGVVEPGFFVEAELAPGRYWLSLIGVGGGANAPRFATHNFGASAPIMGEAMYRVGTGAWTPARLAIDPSIRDLAFKVEGAQRVPAPGAVGLILAAGALAARRQRR